MPEKKVMIYRHPNPDTISLLTGEDISAFRVEVFRNPFGNHYEEALKLLGSIGAQVVKETMVIAGIREVRIKPHELFVKKETSVSWDTIEGRIVEILNRALRKKSIKVIR